MKKQFNEILIYKNIEKEGFINEFIHYYFLFLEKLEK